MFEALLTHAEININHVDVDNPNNFDSTRTEVDISYFDADALYTVFEDTDEELIVEKSREEHDPVEFQGACLDIGAQRSVMGEKQAMAYCTLFKISFKLGQYRRRRVYKFGERRNQGLGSLTIRDR